ncbi:MAG TPA: DUF3332 family protein [Pseudomonadales bacterium]|nr:DUF3332 family protein [Pseudomonadales bacterium]
MKKSIAILTTIIALSSITGCMGRNAMTKSVHDWNLETADSRWGREGLFIVTAPVWFITSYIDLFIVNSIEFWSGKNPINKNGALVDTKVATLEKMGIQNVASAQSRFFENEILTYVTYNDGSKEVLHATRADGVYSFYRGKELVMQVKEDQLKDLQASIKARMETYASMQTATRTL